MKKCFWIGLTLSTYLLFSCKENDAIDPLITPLELEESVVMEESPIPLKIGNRWIYNLHRIHKDSTGAYTLKNLVSTDTITVLRDTLIDNQRYFILSGCITCGFPIDGTEQILRTENRTLFQFQPRVSNNSSGQTGFSLNTNSIPFTEIQNDYYKIEYTTTETNSNTFKITGKVWLKQEDGSYLHQKYADSYYIIDPTQGINNSEVFFTSSSKEKTMGYKKELISFSSVK